MKVTKPLGELVEFMRNGTTAEQNQDGVGYPVTRIETISQGVVDSNRVRFVNLTYNELVKWKLQVGDILFSHINSEEHIGKSALYEGQPTDLVHGMNLLLLRPAQDQVLPSFLHYFLRSPQARSYVRARCKKAINQASINQKELGAMEAIAPPLAEQAKVVDLLTRAEGIVRLRREAAAKAAELIPALFIHHFGDPATNPMGWPVAPLGETAEVISGVAKGRKLSADEGVELPYMRVANVKDGYLDLGEVKTIEIKRTEVDKLRIEVGDLLMTEGGDPDKLGRGALWRGEIENCVHQNHVFKVRSRRDRLVPEYLRSLVGSHYGKSYFLSVAKKTTGIASINKTQLSAFPVLVPPVPLQEVFRGRVEAAESIQRQHIDALAKAQATFDALLAQAFRP